MHLKLIKTSNLLALLFIFTVSLRRFSTLGVFAVTDPSEGRYATIAQQMSLTNDWITLHTFKDGNKMPFLGKPPLHFWLTALSFKVFGYNEIASRIPSFLACLGTALLVFLYANIFFNFEIALGSVIIFLSSLLIFGSAGFCLTDPLLNLTIAGTIVALAFFFVNLTLINYVQRHGLELLCCF
jgi:4-amino-4-deoxy-L-arabinose transferase-like glycosyltransferase